MSIHRPDHQEPTTTSGVPHSGNLPEGLRETPLNDFDNTSLPAAHEQGFLATPDNLATLTDNETEQAPAAPSRRAEKREKRGVPLYVKIGAPVVGLLTLGGIGAGLITAGNAGQPDPNDGKPPGVDGPLVPGPGEGEVEEQPEFPELSVEAIPAGQSAEAYSRQLVDGLSKWVMAGVNDPAKVELYYQTSDAQLPALYQGWAREDAESYADAYFIPDWRNHPDLVEVVEHYTQENAFSYDYYMATQAGNNGEPWSTSRTFESVQTANETESGRELMISGTEHNNASENIIGWELRPEVADQDGAALTPHFETTVIDGHEYISRAIKW